jgi:dTMP kinase
MSAGIFITFEGTDGSGKSTQITLLNGALTSMGFDPIITREPGGTRTGELIRGIILDPANTEISDVTEMMLYAASRAQHVDEIIRPNLAAGRIVISDRFIDSSIAYQGGARGLGAAVAEVNAYAVRECMPDITFLLHAETSALFARIEKGSEDRIEAEGLDMQKSVGEAYLELANKFPERIKLIDAAKPADEIHAEIFTRVIKLTEKRGALNAR